MIYVGYPCVGKSSIAGKSNFIDLESSLFNVNSENWFLAYVTLAEFLSAQGFNVLLSSHKEVREELKRRNLKYICIFPDLSLYDIWFDRCAKRFKNNPIEKNLAAMDRVARFYDKDISDLMLEENIFPISQEQILVDDFDLLEFINSNLKK